MLLASGCATGAKRKAQTASGETAAEVTSALEAVAGSISGKKLSQSEVDALSKDLQTNEETKSAVDSLTGALSGGQPAVYYCPVDGKRFSSRVKTCPEHNVTLKKLE